MVGKSILAMRSFPYRGITRVALVIGLMAFVLPFATVSCGNHETFTATGLNGVTGAQYTVNGQTQTYSGDLSFLLAILGGIFALVCQFLRLQVPARALLSGLASLWSVVMLLMGQAHVSSEFVDFNSRGLLTVRWEAGFWIALVAFSAGAVTMALQFYGTGARSAPTGSADPLAQPRQALFPTFPQAALMPRSLAVTGGGLVAFAASLVLLVACELPYIRYTDSSIQPASASVFNPGFAPSNWFAVEPVGVAVLALVAAVVLVTWLSPIPRTIAAAVLLAYGIQTFLLFLGYVALAVKSPSAQLGPGGVLGMLAGALLFAGGLAAALTLFRRHPAAVDQAAVVGEPT